jgi:hypothetical protein
MAVFTKLNGFVEHLAEGVHRLGTDQLMIALSNVAPGSESVNPNSSTGACVLANITQISYTNLSSRNIAVASSSQTGGVYTLVVNDITLNATGGSVGPFRYVYIFNDTPTTPADPLIGYYDYGGSVTLNNGESLIINFDSGTNVLVQI